MPFAFRVFSTKHQSGYKASRELSIVYHWLSAITQPYWLVPSHHTRGQLMGQGVTSVSVGVNESEEPAYL